MALKDYYHLLHVPAGANYQMVKKAYRKLAMQYHPDKHQNDQAYTVHFREIQEAYTVLSDGEKREAYHYQRWLEQSMGQALDTALTVDQLIRLFVKTEQHISTTDWYSNSNDALLPHLLALFNEARLNTIIMSNDQAAAQTVSALALRCCARLTGNGMEIIQQQLNSILKKYPDQSLKWDSMIVAAKRKDAMAAIKIPVIMLVTLLLCMILFLITR